MTLPLRFTCLVIVTVLSAMAPDARIRAEQTVQPQPRPPATPARDTAPTKPETAVIKGRVVSAEGKPLRRAQVRATAPELRDGRSISTDTEGNYELTALPAGRYTIRFTRSGYLPLSYGQKYPGEAGKLVQLGEGETITGIDVALPRAGVIAGRVTDEIGDPVAGVMIYAMQQRYFNGRRRLVPADGSGRTDDTGSYRLVGLNPGEYWVFGTIRESWVVSNNKEKMVMAFAPTYFPGTSSLTTAQRVRVGIGQEVTSVDFALAVGRAATISGVALGSSGAPIANGTVSLSQEIRGPQMSMMSSVSSATTRADGTWRLTNVAPGEYRISASGTVGGARESVNQPITVDGSDLEGVVLAAGATAMITGQVVIEGEARTPLVLTRLRVLSRNEEMRPVPASSANGAVDQQGHFQLEGAVGAQRILIGALPDGWAVRRIERDGRDITDENIELASGQQFDDVRITLTDRLTIVRGAVLDERRQPTSSGTIVVFADESRYWGENSRFVRGVRPNQSGEFEVKGLPPGSYRAVALEYIQEGDWNDPEVLSALRDRAARFLLAEDEKKAVDLELTK